MLGHLNKSADKGGCVELHLLADLRNYNLLLLAAESGNTKIFKLLLDQNLQTELHTEKHDVRAQDLAWKNGHSEIILILIKAGATYPITFNLNECSEELKLFCEKSEEMHADIIAGKEESVKNILNNSQRLHPYYNRSNESAAKIALDSKQISIYKLLVAHKVFLGRNEIFHNFWTNFSEIDRESLRKIHFKNSVHVPEKHIYDLSNCSSVSHDDKNAKSNLNLAQYSFQILNQNPLIRIILMIVSFSRKLNNIIFDFKSTTVDVVDPTAQVNSRGLFYTKGIICVAAGFLLDQSSEHETFGTLAHELCHFAMNLVYRNIAKPYKQKDRKRRQEFEKISR